MQPIWYDDAVPCFARIISDVLGENALLDNLILRDVSGVLTFVVLQEVSEEQRRELSTNARSLSPYVDAMPIATPDDLFDEDLKSRDIGITERVEHQKFTGFVRIVERRIAGHDWLRAPAPPMRDIPPIVAFVSHKGGVGRSTALCVSASHLATGGKNVLVIDLDLEAPGLGIMLLPDDRLPRFGALDYYVENGLRHIDDSFLEDMIAISPLTTGRGVVHVVPAVGLRSDRDPQNVLGKLSRAYLEDLQLNENPKTFLDQTRDLIQSLSGHRRYDVILVDARAGLNEESAAVILGLGAHTLLFGIHTPQTFKGYRYLLSFLGRYRGLVENPAVGEWRARLRMVHAKASADPIAWERFHDDAYELFADTLYDEVNDETGEGSEPFNFARHSDDAPHKAWPILSDSNFAEFDPLSRPEQLGRNLFARSFDVLINGIEKIIEEKERVGSEP